MIRPLTSEINVQPAVEALVRVGKGLSALFLFSNPHGNAFTFKTINADGAVPFLTVPRDALETLCESLRERVAEVPELDRIIETLKMNLPPKRTFHGPPPETPEN